jgi:enterochelin esterase family protein
MLRLLYFFILCLTQLCALNALAQQPRKGKGAGPVNLKPLAAALADPSQSIEELEKLVFRTFGKQNLAMGKVVARLDERLGAWAVMNPSPASVLDAAGAPLGTMKPVGSMGLQVLALELPNFSNVSYRVEVAGSTLLAGEFHVEVYDMPPEWKPSDLVPAGRQETFEFSASKVFPQTSRTVTVYIPANYKPDGSAALMVWQDGGRHADRNGQVRATVVMDHLIANKQMPVTVGVFVDPGQRPNQKPGEKPANRGFEYDSLGDAYVRFITEEVLPEVKARYQLNWSDRPEMRAIAGGSSGGICAFTAAWERPQQFGKVLSWVGSFVNLRGGHVYPALVRKTERKPIRVYLLDGRNDLDNNFGNWPLANLSMAAALKHAGYDYRLDYGECFHGSKGMSASLPEAMRWLWRDIR